MSMIERQQNVFKDMLRELKASEIITILSTHRFLELRYKKDFTKQFDQVFNDLQCVVCSSW